MKANMILVGAIINTIKVSENVNSIYVSGAGLSLKLRYVKFALILSIN